MPVGVRLLPWSPGQQGTAASPDATRPFELTREDEALLDDLERRSFRYFWEQGETPTGQVRDRARADGGPHPQAGIGSIAATGFGLTALCIAADRGWAPRDAIVERASAPHCGSSPSGMPHERGWFYHFVNLQTGAREWKCELSSIDTALLLAGVLTARQCFDERRRYRAATRRRSTSAWTSRGC